MIYIKADENKEIQVISYETIDDPTCVLAEIPVDFSKYIAVGKYLADKDGLSIKEGWEQLWQSHLKRISWAQNKPYRLVLRNKTTIESLFKDAQTRQLLLYLADDFAEQFSTNDEFTEIYLNSTEPYEGVSVDWLIATFSNVFLRIERNPYFVDVIIK